MTQNLPSLQDVIKNHGLDARKALGQHFLLDMNITRKIARLANAGPDDHIIEVGPGPGGLTRALLETGAHVSAIERDERCLDILNELQDHWPEQLTVYNEDALRTDYQSLISRNETLKFVSNLPYNIATELLIGWLTLTPDSWYNMTLMFQREVADRILALPGSKTYGRLSVLAQTTSIPSRGYDLPARAFTPPPKVESSVVTFTPPTWPFPYLKALESITRAAFSQRRKMVRSSMKPVFGDKLTPMLEQAEIPLTTRAEDISVVSYQRLATIMMDNSKKAHS